MPKVYNLNNYPPEYIRLIQAVLEGNEISVTFPSRTEATRARFNFYEFKKALRASLEEHHRVLAADSELIAIKMEDNTLIYYNRDSSIETQLLSAALQNIRSPLPGISPDRIEKELLELQTPKTQDDILAEFLSLKTVDSNKKQS